MIGVGLAITQWRTALRLNGAQSLLDSEDSGLAIDFTDQSAVVVYYYASDMISAESSGLAIDFTTDTAVVKEAA